MWSSRPHHSWSTTTPGPLRRPAPRGSPVRYRRSPGTPRLPLLIPFLDLSCELPADGHAHKHAHPGLLGEQRADAGGALALVAGRRRGADLGLVRLAEPAALVQRLGQDLLKLWRELG